ncbi:MAG: phosphoribosyltransferase family protein [Acidobacteriota bacterium]
MRKKLRKAYSAKQIAKRVEALAAEIRKDAGDTQVFLLGVLKGTTCFVADLLRATPGDVGYGFIDVVRDAADALTHDAIEIDFLNYIDIGGKNVYLIKDVVATGVIENYLLTQLRQKGPAALKLVALIDRPSLRTVDLDADFRAFKVDEGNFVGYGLELEGLHANLSYLARV